MPATTSAKALSWVEQGYVPDRVIRLGIRRLLQQRLAETASDDLVLRCQDDLRIQQHWRWSGTHYQKTAEAWLQRMDDAHEELTPILQSAYRDDAEIWRMRWRIFFMSVAELFGHSQGQRWLVSHYLFGQRP